MDMQSINIDTILDLWVRHRIKIIIIGVVVGGSVGAGIYTYFNRIRRQEMAQVAMSETLLEVQRAQRNPEAWQDVQLAAKTGYRQFSNTSLAPYFLMIEAEASLEQSKKEEGLMLLQETLKNLSMNSPLYFMVALKIARVKLDMDTEDVRNQGLKELEAIAYNTKNHQRDAALYYLGLYYEQSNPQKAAEIWQEITEISKKQQEIPNVWASLVSRRISQESQ
jgi:tetratricopeptide (TPR) repeat protein